MESKGIVIKGFEMEKENIIKLVRCIYGLNIENFDCKEIRIIGNILVLNITGIENIEHRDIIIKMYIEGKSRSEISVIKKTTSQNIGCKRELAIKFLKHPKNGKAARSFIDYVMKK